MAQENNKKPAKPAAPQRQRETLGERLKGIKVEMKKVVWPTKKELGTFTVVVLVTCAFFALAFWGLDSAVLAGLKAILGITL